MTSIISGIARRLSASSAKESGALATAYALIRDTLVILVVTLGTLLTAESILPGFVTSRLNLTGPVMATTITAFCLAYLSGYFDTRPLGTATPSKKTWTLSASAIIWAAALTMNALLAFPWWAAAAILALTIALGVVLTKSH